MESKKLSVLVVLVAVMVFMASVVSGRELKSDGQDKYGIVASRAAILNAMLAGVQGTGKRCPGSFCLDDIMACAPGCGCLIIPGVCYGECCKD